MLFIWPSKWNMHNIYLLRLLNEISEQLANIIMIIVQLSHCLCAQEWWLAYLWFWLLLLTPSCHNSQLDDIHFPSHMLNFPRPQSDSNTVTYISLLYESIMHRKIRISMVSLEVYTDIFFCFSTSWQTIYILMVS